jgi:hypothetical protein
MIEADTNSVWNSLAVIIPSTVKSLLNVDLSVTKREPVIVVSVFTLKPLSGDIDAVALPLAIKD